MLKTAASGSRGASSGDAAGEMVATLRVLTAKEDCLSVHQVSTSSQPGVIRGNLDSKKPLILQRYVVSEGPA